MKTFCIFAVRILQLCDMDKKLNRIKVVLADNGKTNKWLAEQLGKDPATVSKWCTNVSQPSLETLLMISKLLDVDVNELVRLDWMSDTNNPNKI